MDQIIFATGNEGKMKEIREILKDLDVPILSLKDANIEVDIDENGDSFRENAIIKAQAVAELTDSIVLADDSGLEVDYLNKEPGIYSARYMGEDTSYKVKNASIIDRLDNVPVEEKTARFFCEIAAILPNKEILTSRGTVEGLISYEEQGFGGFGYDPIFYLPEYLCTLAQLTLEQKNEISHRGKALEEMKKLLLKHLRY